MERRRWWSALAGIAAGAVALGLAELMAVLTGAGSAPVVAVGGVVVDTVPKPVKEFAIAVFGVYDKIALLTGTCLLLVAFAALIGWSATADPRRGYTGIALLGLLGAVAAVSRPGAGPAAALPSLAGALAGAVALRTLLPGLPRLPTPVSSVGSVVGPAGRSRPGAAVADRRRFLSTAAAFVGAAAVVGAAGRLLSSRRDVSAAREALRLPAPASPAPPLPAGVDPRLPGLAPYVTPNGDFYRIDTALVVPRVDPADWELRIHGRVRRPVTLSFDDLLRRPMVERHVTLACVSNEVGGDLIGNARWLGVPVKDLLDEVEPLAGADQVVGRSVDGWTCGTPTEVLRDGRDALLAVGMNGEPLPIEHGFPVRMVVPGLYGYVSACKWLAELELTSFDDFDAYWVPRGWAARGPVKTQSRIDTPRVGARLPSGTVAVAGVAWAQHRGIAAVQVRVDGGPWQNATLAGTVSTDTWRQWWWRWTAEPGEHVVSVRAIDATGEVQTEERRPVDPDGATGWHTVTATATG